MPLRSLDALLPGQPWPPEDEAATRNRWRINRALFDGDHDTAYGLINRKLRPELEQARRFVLNFQKRLSTHWADMLFGEAPVLTVANGSEREYVADLAARTGLSDTAHEAAIDVSRFGVGVLSVRLQNNQAVIEAQQPEYWYPVVNPTNIREVRAQVLAWELMIGRTRYLRLQIHERGRITNRLHRLGVQKIGTAVDLSLLGEDAPQEEELTGTEDFLLIPVHNLRTTGDVYGHDDYSDLDSLVMELEARLGQMSRILDKHADPGMHGPASALEQDPVTLEWRFKAAGYIVTDAESKPPGYVTWDGNLDAALAAFNVLIEQLYVLAETSPAAFGQIRSGLAESGSALKRLLTADLTKTNRLRKSFDHAIKAAVRVASELEREHNGLTTPYVASVGIGWRDGLPEDESEVSQIVERLMTAGAMSAERAVRRLNAEWSDEDVAAEVARIRAGTGGGVDGQQAAV